MAWFGSILLIPLYFQQVLGYSATLSGSALTPALVCSSGASIFSGWLLSIRGRYRAISLIGGLISIVGATTMLTLGVSASTTPAILGMVLIGVGAGAANGSFVVGYQNALRTDQFGIGMGVMSLFRQIGATLGTTTLGALVAGGQTGELPPPILAASIHHAVFILLAAVILMLAVSLLMKDAVLRGKAIAVPVD